MDELDVIIDDIVGEIGPMPYAERVNGIWDIFDGERHVYCGDGAKALIDEVMRKAGENLK